MRLLLLTPEYTGTGGGIMTFYRTLGAALRDAGVELHVIEGSGLHAAASRSHRFVEGIAIQTLEQARLIRWEPLPSFGGTAGITTLSRSCMGDVGAGGLSVNRTRSHARG